MTEQVYEIRVNGKIVNVDKFTWDRILEHVREQQWFYIMYNGQAYRYYHDQEYDNRPTRFDFISVDKIQSTIDFIYVN